MVKQTKYLMSGNTLPRLQTEDVFSIPIPIIDPILQRKIVEEVNKKQAEAENLRHKAEQVLEQAKRKVEEMLLSGSQE